MSSRPLSVFIRMDAFQGVDIREKGIKERKKRKLYVILGVICPRIPRQSNIVFPSPLS